MSKPKTDPRIVFLDLETTGLDVVNDVILEIGIVVVSRRLRHVPGGDFSRLIRWEPPPDTALMDKDVVEMHRKSGLFDDCKRSGVSLEQAESDAIDFLELHDFDERDRIVVGGFSPGFDVSFLKSDMDRLATRLSHRTFDVSTIRDLVARLVGHDAVYAWRDAIHKPFPEAHAHRALPDCIAAIRELREYAKHFDIDSMRKAIDSIGGGDA